MKRIKGPAGFTLLEILLALTILAILSTLGIAGYRHSRRAAAETVLEANLAIIRHALEQYKADRGKYPGSLEDLAREANKQYLREIPIDPILRTNKMWQVEYEQPDPDNPEGESGVSNVRSGASGTTLDGKPYSDL